MAGTSPTVLAVATVALHSYALAALSGKLQAALSDSSCKKEGAGKRGLGFACPVHSRRVYPVKGGVRTKLVEWSGTV